MLCVPSWERATSAVKQCARVASPVSIAANESSAYCKPCTAGTYSNENGTACLECPAGSYRQHAVSMPEDCSDVAYCPNGSPNPIVAEPGRYVDDHKTVSLPCMPGHYCLHGKKMLCSPNTYGDLHNHTSQTCSGTCAYLYQSNESRTKCVLNPGKVILVACLLCFVMLGGVYFLRRRFKKNKARVKSLQDELQNANVLQKRTKR